MRRVLAAFVLAPTLAAAAPDPVDDAMTALVAGDFAKVAAAFDPASEPPTAARVAQTWRAKAQGMGAPSTWRLADRTRQDGLETRVVLIDCARGQLEALVSIDPDSHRIASLFLTRPAPPATYVDRARFHEVAVSVGHAPFALPGTLLVPEGKGPFPGVVLVHGSGPNDRDETVGAEKPFRDVAEGLASAGIAVLRYDKRTFAYADRLDNTITLEDEVMVDAIDAVHVLAARPEIDRARVFVIGHSLGAMLAPDIAQRAGHVAGVALLAPPGREPWDIVQDQMRYLRAPKQLRIDAARASATLATGFGDAGGEIMGMPASYWQEWASHDGAKTASALGVPVLLLHGDRDYQVTATDVAIWKAGLAGAHHAELVELHGDNHLLIAGHGTPSPVEYKVPAHVDARVIARIVRFVKP